MERRTHLITCKSLFVQHLTSWQLAGDRCVCTSQPSGLFVQRSIIFIHSKEMNKLLWFTLPPSCRPNISGFGVGDGGIWKIVNSKLRKLFGGKKNRPNLAYQRQAHWSAPRFRDGMDEQKSESRITNYFAIPCCDILKTNHVMTIFSYQILTSIRYYVTFDACKIGMIKETNDGMRRQPYQELYILDRAMPSKEQQPLANFFFHFHFPFLLNVEWDRDFAILDCLETVKQRGEGQVADGGIFVKIKYFERKWITVAVHLISLVEQ